MQEEIKVINQSIRLESNTIKVLSKYSGKTKFNFWSELQVNDILKLEMLVEKTGGNRGVNYTLNLLIRNLRTEQEFQTTINSMISYLEKINYEC